MAKRMKKEELEGKILDLILGGYKWIDERDLRTSLKRKSSLYPILSEMERKGLLRTVKKKGFRQKFYRLGWNGKRKEFKKIMEIKEKRKRKRKLDRWHREFEKGRSKLPIEKELEEIARRKREKLYSKRL